MSPKLFTILLYSVSFLRLGFWLFVLFLYMGEIMQPNIPAMLAVFCIFAVGSFFAVDVIMPVNSSFSFLGASLSDGCVLVKLLCVFRL